MSKAKGYIENGDVVMLASGSPAMTVMWVDTAPVMTGFFFFRKRRSPVLCRWHAAIPHFLEEDTHFAFARFDFHELRFWDFVDGVQKEPTQQSIPETAK